MIEIISKDELLNILKNVDISEILLYSKKQLEEMFGKEFAMQKDFDQNNPHHCYTLLEHSLQTVKTIRTLKIDEKDKELLLVAALYHDLGKPFTQKKKDDKSVYYGHSKKSAELLAEFIGEFGFSDEASKKILFWVKHHDDFISYAFLEEKTRFQTSITPQSIKEYIKKRFEAFGENEKQLMLLLCQLSIADAKAQAEETYKGDVLINSRQKKVDRFVKIMEYIQII